MWTGIVVTGDSMEHGTCVSAGQQMHVGLSRWELVQQRYQINWTITEQLRRTFIYSF